MTQPLRASVLLLAALALPWRASAAHHSWQITEIYSNADGTVQFVELIGTADGEQGIVGFTIDTSPLGTTGLIPTSASLAGPALPSTTGGMYYLVGTAGYATLAAAQSAPAPDATLPDDFLELLADTVRYAGIPATDVAYTAGQLPTDGIDSLDLESPGGTVNTPQNSAGASGSIDASVMSVPMLPRLAAILLMGLLVLSTSLLLRRRAQARSA